MSDMIKATYVSNGSFHAGIPARDITEAEWQQLSEDQQQRIKESPLYKMVPTKKQVAKDGK